MQSELAMAHSLQPLAGAELRCLKARYSAMGAQFLPAGAGHGCFGQCCPARSAAMAAYAAVVPAAAQRCSAVHWAAMAFADRPLSERCCQDIVQAEVPWAEAAQHTQQEAEAEHMLVGMAAPQAWQRAGHWQRWCWLVLEGPQRVLLPAVAEPQA